MAKQPRPPVAPVDSTPEEFAQVQPRDLYATSDIRFVMIEIGKLTASVDRLIDDVNSHRDKVDELRTLASQMTGGIRVGLWVGLPLLAGFIGLALYLLNQKWDTAIEVLKAIGSQN